jgi:hypothetical protein
MRPRHLAVAALAAVSTFALAACPSTTQLRVRVEGNTQTLFEGPINTTGHSVRAASDTQSRTCDGTNGGANPSPGPTPTASTVDAMKIIGRDFDARWYPAYTDYFIQRWGPDRENTALNQYWGILVNGRLIPVGGCQYRDAANDEVFWAYDAFNSKPFLRLAASSDTSAAPGPPQFVVYVNSGRTLAVKVQRYTGGVDGSPQNLGPAVGVKVAPVTTASSGFQTVNTGDARAVTTTSSGTATYTFPGTGWYRIKAAGTGFIRSNRLDVCVRPTPSTDCGALPADAQVRTPPAAAAAAKLEALAAR